MCARHRTFLRGAAVLMALALGPTAVSSALAQGKVSGDTAPQVSSSAPPSTLALQPDFHPSMGDLMTLLVQPRHIKLGLAGQAANWRYAAYEVGELRGAFRRVGLSMPIYNKQDFPALIAAMMTPSLTAVQAAIQKQSSIGFTAAYAQLTAACNACHLSQNHAAVVIKIPRSNPYADQELQPTTVK